MLTRCQRAKGIAGHVVPVAQPVRFTAKRIGEPSWKKESQLLKEAQEAFRMAFGKISGQVDC